MRQPLRPAARGSARRRPRLRRSSKPQGESARRRGHQHLVPLCATLQRHEVPRQSGVRMRGRGRPHNYHHVQTASALSGRMRGSGRTCPPPQHQRATWAPLRNAAALRLRQGLWAAAISSTAEAVPSAAATARVPMGRTATTRPSYTPKWPRPPAQTSYTNGPSACFVQPRRGRRSALPHHVGRPATTNPAPTPRQQCRGNGSAFPARHAHYTRRETMNATRFTYTCV